MLAIEFELKQVYLSFELLTVQKFASITVRIVQFNIDWVCFRFIFTRFVLLARGNLDEPGPHVGERQLRLSRGQLRFRRTPSENLSFLPTSRPERTLINTLCQLLIAFVACC